MVTIKVCPTFRILRRALDKIAEIKSLLEERRIGAYAPASHLVCLAAGVPSRRILSVAAAKMAGVYSDSDPPRKTMRRGVLMTLLQQSAMTLPLWIGKPGERYRNTLFLLGRPPKIIIMVTNLTKITVSLHFGHNHAMTTPTCLKRELQSTCQNFASLPLFNL